MYIYLLQGGKTQDSWVTHGDLNRLETQEQKNKKKPKKKTPPQ